MRSFGQILVLAVGLALIGGLALYVVDTTPAADFPAVEFQSDRPRPQGDVLRGAVPEPHTFNPFTTMEAVATRYVLPFTHDTLFDRDPEDASLRPAAATAADWSDDRRTLTFTLRDDLRFADGSPVTRADLRFTLAVARHPRTQPQSDMSYWLAGAAGAEAPDAGTIVVRFAEPALEADRTRLATSIRLASRQWFVDEVHTVAPDAEPLSDAFVDALAAYRGAGPGTGAYRIATLPAERDAGRRLDLVQNPHSWRRAAQPLSWNLAGVRLEFLVDDGARFAALKHGRLDWFAPSGGTTVSELTARDPTLAERFAVHTYDPAHVGHYWVIWNCRDELLDEPRVRRALGMLFDRETLLREVFHGLGSIARGYFKPGMPEYPGDDTPGPAFAPDAARRLLESVDDVDLDAEQAPRIEILVPAAPTLRRIVEIAQPAFAAAGLELVAQPVDPVAIAERLESGDFQGVVLVDQHEMPIDPYDTFHSRGNRMGYASAEMDAVLEEARSTDDPQRRLALYARFHELLRRDQPVTLLVHPEIELLLHRRFRDARPGPLGLWFERFWVPLDEQLLAPGVPGTDTGG